MAFAERRNRARDDTQQEQEEDGLIGRNQGNNGKCEKQPTISILRQIRIAGIHATEGVWGLLYIGHAIGGALISSRLKFKQRVSEFLERW
jgi:hypothetical protein